MTRCSNRRSDPLLFREKSKGKSKEAGAPQRGTYGPALLQWGPHLGRLRSPLKLRPQSRNAFSSYAFLRVAREQTLGGAPARPSSTRPALPSDGVTRAAGGPGALSQRERHRRAYSRPPGSVSACGAPLWHSCKGGSARARVDEYEWCGAAAVAYASPLRSSGGRERQRKLRGACALGARSACVLGAILRSLGVNIPCLGVNGVLPRHAEPGADALGSVCVAGMLVAAFLGSRRVNTKKFRIWTIWRCNGQRVHLAGSRNVRP